MGLSSPTHIELGISGTCLDLRGVWIRLFIELGGFCKSYVFYTSMSKIFFGVYEIA